MSIGISQAGLLSEGEGKNLLRAHGIKTTAPSLAGSLDELRQILARDPGQKFVLKLSMETLVHKTAVGGVTKGVCAANAEVEYSRLLEIGNSLVDEYGRFYGVLVEEEIAEGLELVIGFHLDPGLGPLVMIGNGGTNVEHVRCVAFAAAPLSAPVADQMIAEWAGLPGSFGCVLSTAERAVLSRYLVFIAGEEGLVFKRAVTSLDINPLIVGAGSVTAVDAVIIAEQDGSGPQGWLRHMVEVVRKQPPDLSKLFDPDSIAVIGASPDPQKVGNKIVFNLVDFGYKGTLYPINPDTSRKIVGLQPYASVKDIPGHVDKAIVLVNNKQVAEVVEECKQARVDIVQIYSSGFSESSEKNTDAENKVLEAIKGANTRVVGPNCWGAYSPRSRITTTASDASSTVDGNVAFVSQSGTYFADVVRRANVRGMGLYGSVSIGNCLDVMPYECAQFLLADPRVQVLGMYLEGARDTRLLSEIARLSKKPIVVMRGGRSAEGAQAARSHTAALVADDAAWVAAMRRGGMVLVDTIEDMMDALSALSLFEKITGPRLTLFGTGGGVAITGADLASTMGLSVASFDRDVESTLRDRYGSPGTSMANPIDLTVWDMFRGERSIASDVLRTVATTAVSDSVIIYLEMGSLFDVVGKHRAEKLVDMLISDLGSVKTDVPVSLVLRSGGAGWEDEIVRLAERDLRPNHVGVYWSIRDAIRAHAMVFRSCQGISSRAQIQ